MAKITKMNPVKHIVGATLILLILKMSGSKCVSVELGPHIIMKPIIIAATPAASSM